MDLDPPGLVRPPDAKRDRDSAALELGTEARNYVGTGRAPARRRCGSRPRSPPRPRAQFMRCAQRDAVDAPGGASARRSPSARIAEARGVARRCSARRAKQPAATRPAHCRFRDKGGRQPRDDQVAGIGAIQQLTVDRAASAGGFRSPWVSSHAGEARRRCWSGRIGAVALRGGWLLQTQSFRNCSTSRVAPLHSEQISAARRNRGRRVSAAPDVPRSSLIDSIATTPAVRSYDLGAPIPLDPAASSRSSVRMQIRLSARRDVGPAIGDYVRSRFGCNRRQRTASRTPSSTRYVRCCNDVNDVGGDRRPDWHNGRRICA